MNSVDPFEDFHDMYDALPPARPTGSVNGVNLADLEKTGIELEVEPNAYSGGEEEENEKERLKNYKSDEIWQHVNPECMQAPDSSTPFDHLESIMDDITSGQGMVFKKIIRPGIGLSIPEGATVKVHYNGYLEYSDEPYDSTRLRNKPLTIRLGTHQVIEGLEVGVASMRKEEVSQFLVKSPYAFGDMGCPPRIPPAASILFEVEVLSFVDHSAADSYDELPDEDKAKVSLKEIVNVANAEREAGNDFFGQKMYGRATNHYIKAIRLLESSRLQDEEEEELWKDSLMKLYINLSLTNLKQRKPKCVITNCRRVLELKDNNVKATFTLAKAFSMLGEWSESRKYLVKAIKLSPNNAEIRKEMAKLDSKIREFEVMERGLYSRMFQSDANGASSDPETDSSLYQEGEEELTVSEEVKAALTEKLEQFNNNHSMCELVLPIGTSQEEIKCIQAIARNLGMDTTLGNESSQFSIKVVKPDLLPPEDLNF
ncbi:PREDICTED: inactive peptidyl-prolyl cis-trans isomerase FKBP6-like [Amphimedon queenslandica]|uniref:peptidylprolyl isomerase n=1 Tax=Amphimedon queenslandica TaxID=400682 RepID=A0A1X7V8C2_AMPQE|nr:PREDICTED: inactive peptidyl-prolyl cis-trans isomerase FKBP6-like [Amphimedon queenslandica]|eukprot:XP_011402831.2 PREDICTED: inactive peptidyl-prolyl cis-trans isomerase FKBP6-like [Amphimedon queenslandica]